MTDKKFMDLKIRTWFKMNNIKGNGRMGKTDFEEIADIFKREYELKDPQYSLLKKWLCEGWDILVKEGQDLANSGKKGGLTPDNAASVFDVSETLNKGEAITEDQYANAFEQLVEVNQGLFQNNFEMMVGSFFDIYDTDHDGKITADDMIRGLRCLGIQQDEAVKIMFANMDTEKRGSITKSVYVSEWVEYMLGTRKDAAIASVLCRQ
ncbi:unnamed protein product [Mytilus edulis]|uniref:EF-hand domain-containing protein n=1 Tax=Mytilus edulis TaxID=6550 RepID=A0A8S3T3S9_MYTED|nr:unnamed protein product [Mytilus edulis]